MQQKPHRATSHPSRLESHLKKAQEEKAQPAQQNADLAASQRSELETQLKKAEEKAQLAQQNTDLLISQRSSLQTQLEKAKEDAQLAQQKSDLGTRKRSAVQTQHKKASGKATRKNRTKKRLANAKER